MNIFGRDNGSTVVRNVASDGTITYIIDPDGVTGGPSVTLDNQDFNLRSAGAPASWGGSIGRVDALFRLDPGAKRVRPVWELRFQSRPVGSFPRPANQRLPDQGDLLDRKIESATRSLLERS
jgi:hypothetical protein